jgi:hypothetical protein
MTRPSIWQRLSYVELSFHFRPFWWRLEWTPWAPGNSLFRAFVGPFGIKIWRLN